jgi:aromatic amino acid aminotransferase I
MYAEPRLLPFHIYFGRRPLHRRVPAHHHAACRLLGSDGLLPARYFAERLERIRKMSTQNPCGLILALVMALLTQWTFDGYFRWLHGLRTQYKHRRDHFLAKEFKLLPASPNDDPVSLCACPRGGGGGVEKTGPLLMSFVPSSSGRMFVWVTLYFAGVPEKTNERDRSILTPEQQFWKRLADADALSRPRMDLRTRHAGRLGTCA